MTKAAQQNSKGFFISFSLHSILALSFLYLNQNQTIPVQKMQNCISIALSSFEQAEKAEPQKTESKQVLKPIVKQKEEVVVTKAMTQTQHVVEERVEKSFTTKEQAAVQVVAEAPQEVRQTAQKHVEAALTSQVFEEEFVRTNFEIIRDKVLSKLKYPPIAKRMGQTGVVEIVLIIDTNGKLLDAIVEKSSGHKLLDKSALSAAEKLCGDVLPIPQVVSKVTLPIYFAMN